MTYAFTLPIEPVAWGRVKRGRYGQAYVPPKTLLYERQVAMLARKHAPASPLKGAISVEIALFLPRPKRCKRPYPCVRPDADNFAKAITDALNGIFYEDDGQIVRLEVEKIYAGPSGPSIYVEIYELPKRKTVDPRPVEQGESE